MTADDLARFIADRLDEEERDAQAATPGPWRVDDVQYAEQVSADDGVDVVAGGRWGGEASVFETTEDAVHIARHDPARALAFVAAGRAILEEHTPGNDRCDGDGPQIDLPCPTLLAFGAIWAGHDDWREEWKP